MLFLSLNNCILVIVFLGYGFIFSHIIIVTIINTINIPDTITIITGISVDTIGIISIFIIKSSSTSFHDIGYLFRYLPTDF